MLYIYKKISKTFLMAWGNAYNEMSGKVNRIQIATTLSITKNKWHTYTEDRKSMGISGICGIWNLLSTSLYLSFIIGMW